MIKCQEINFFHKLFETFVKLSYQYIHIYYHIFPICVSSFISTHLDGSKNKQNYTRMEELYLF